MHVHAALLAFAASTLLARPVHGQRVIDGTHRAEPPRPRNSAQADLGLAVIGLAYERVLTPYVAVQFEVQTFATWFGPFFGFPNFVGYGGQVRPTFFLFGTAPVGLYLAPYLRVDYVSTEYAGVTGSGIGWSGGAFVGYSILIARYVNLRIGAGGQYMSYAVRAGDSIVRFPMFFPALDIVVGVAF